MLSVLAQRTTTALRQNRTVHETSESSCTSAQSVYNCTSFLLLACLCAQHAKETSANKENMFAHQQLNANFQIPINTSLYEVVVVGWATTEIVIAALLTNVSPRSLSRLESHAVMLTACFLSAPLQASRLMSAMAVGSVHMRSPHLWCWREGWRGKG